MTRFTTPRTGPDDPAAEQMEAALARLEAHWQQVRGPRLMPARGGIAAQEIEPILPWVFVAEPVGATVLRIRHAGRRLFDMVRMEPRGMPLCAFFSPQGRAALRPLVGAMLTGPAIIGMGLTAGRGVTRPKVAARLLLLPLSDDGLQPDRVIGALVSDGPAGQRPLRFDCDGHAARISHLRPASSMPRLVSKGGMRSAGQGQRPALRLVISDG